MEVTPNSPQFAKVKKDIELNELYFHVYLHQTYQGPRPNQRTIADPKLDKWFGLTVANDWPLRDGVAPDAKIVARARGLHLQASMEAHSWHNSFTIEFEDEKFKGSTLQVMGCGVKHGEWAIVGGTGEFTLANGIIYKKLLEENPDGSIVELHIHAFFLPLRTGLTFRTGVPCWSLGQ